MTLASMGETSPTHYPMITNHPFSWVLVSLIVVAGASLRHFLIRHDVGDSLRKIGWTAVPVLAALVFAILMTAPRNSATTGAAGAR